MNPCNYGDEEDYGELDLHIRCLLSQHTSLVACVIVSFTILRTVVRHWFSLPCLQINLVGEPFLNVNAQHLQTFDAELYRQLVAYPQEVIPTFDMATNELFFERFPDTTLEHQIQVRPYNALVTTNMRSLNPEGTLVKVTCIALTFGLRSLLNVTSHSRDFLRSYFGD